MTDEDNLLDTSQEDFVRGDSVSEGIVKSKARQDIRDKISNIDVSNFDATPWTDPNIIRPIPGKQEQFLMTEDVQVVWYGG